MGKYTRKSNKKAEKRDAAGKILIISLLFIAISTVFFIGSTLAWFSDSVKSSNNKIIAGNLDVALYHLVDGAREKIDENTKLFDIALWEPGAVVYENFEIANEGALALKYEFLMNIANFNVVNNTGKSLKDVLKVAIVNGEFTPTTRDDLKTLDFSKTIYDFKREDSLYTKGSSHKFAIVVYWEPSENDNDYNLNTDKTSNDGEPLFIDLGVSLVANQRSYEEDSFGNDYDKKVLEVRTEAEFRNSIAKSTNNEIIRLTDNISISGDYLLPPANTDITIDLNNKTLSSNTLILVGPGRKLAINNGILNLDQAGLNYPTTYVYSNASLTLNNINYISNTASGVSPYGQNAVININNCEFNTVGFAISTNASESGFNPIINIKNSTFVASSDPNQTGTPILFNNPGQLNIENSVIEGHYQAVVVRGGTAVIKNSTLTNKVDSNEYVDKFKNAYWGQGNDAPIAVITMGNKTATTTSYNYPTNVTLINTKLESQDGIYPEVYAYGNSDEGMGVTFNYDEKSTVEKVVVGNDKVVINGTNATVNE